MRWLLQGLDWYGPYKLRSEGFLKDAGWFRSFRENRAVDRDGNPIPWIAYGAIRFLSRRIRPEFSVFEYGMGASTLWWASRVARLVACEHDEAWLAELRPQLPAGIELIRRDLECGGNYSRTVADYPNAFDIVVIDGRDRVNCARHAVTGLKPAGVIVWDDTDRPNYRPGIEALRGEGFRSIEFTGLAPGKIAECQTSIFYREGNCLGI